MAAPSGPQSTWRGTAAGPDLGGLLRASGRGDEAAFAEVYDATSSRVYGLVLRVLRDPAQSQEVTQEVFLDVWRSSAQFDETRGSALSWVLTLAHRRAVDRVRSAQASLDREDTYGSRNQERSYDETAETVERRLDAQGVRRALGSLTETQRNAIQLAYLDGLTHTEVASQLNVPLGTAKTRIRDGLIRLRDTLGVHQ